jgi:hypothetical protein
VLGFTINRNDDVQAVFAEGTISGMRGERDAGFCRLTRAIWLYINPAPDTGSGRPRLTGLVADVHTGGLNIGRFVGHPWRWGVLQVPAYQAQSREVYLECDMDRSRLEAIEEIRARGNLDLSISIQAQVDGGRWPGIR